MGATHRDNQKNGGRASEINTRTLDTAEHMRYNIPMKTTRVAAFTVNAVVVDHIIDPDGDEWLIRSIPNGWDDVKGGPKVLEFGGNVYCFTGWNSDTLLQYYKRDGIYAKVYS